MAFTQETGEEGSVFNRIPPDSGSNLIRLAGNYSFPNTEGVETSTDEGRSVFEDPPAPEVKDQSRVVSTPPSVVSPDTKTIEPAPPGMKPVYDLFGYNPEAAKELGPKSLKAAEEKVREDEAATKQGIGAMTHRMRELETIRNAEGHTIADLPPKWDADRESKERIRGPIEGFGSFATIFALAASAFTKQPALNALTAAGAAMTAIHKSDVEGYERAYTAWKDNTELVQKRFNMEHQVFQDTASLYEKDNTLWRAKMEANAARFGNQRMQALLAAGLDGEVFKLMDAGNKAMDGMLEHKIKFEDYNTRIRLREALIMQSEKDHPDWTEPQKAMYKALTFQESMPAKTEAEHIVHQQEREYFNTHSEPMPAEEKARLLQQARYAPGRSGKDDLFRIVEKLREEDAAKGIERPIKEVLEEAERIQAAGKVAVAEVGAGAKVKAAEVGAGAKVEAAEIGAEAKVTATRETNESRERIAAERQSAEQALAQSIKENPNTTKEEKDKALKEIMAAKKSLGSTTLTTDRQISQDIAKKREGWKAEGLTDAEIAEQAAAETRRLKTLSAPITGNRRDDIAKNITRADAFDQTINKVEKLLKKHNAMTGLGGTLTRPMEVVGNWFGSNETDRAQFKSYISELQEWGARLLNESSSRPLSADEKRITAIVPGLSAGDTTVNTAKRLLELQKLSRNLRENMKSRYEGTWTPEKSSTPATAEPAKPWTPPAGDKPVQ